MMRKVAVLCDAIDVEEQRAIVAELGEFLVPVSGQGERIDYKRPLGLAEVAARRAFSCAAKETLFASSSELSAQAIVYGCDGSMACHVDSSVDGTKPLVILSFGCSCDFHLDAETLHIASGTALVFDAAQSMHGVARIHPGTSPLASLKDARVSIMFWQKPTLHRIDDLPFLDSLATTRLFQDDDDDAYHNNNISSSFSSCCGEEVV